MLINVNKNGFVYVIDRTNGKVIAAHPFTNQGAGRDAMFTVAIRDARAVTSPLR